MREIKFRGLDENNEWVYGDHVRLILGGNIHYYIQPLDSKRISVIYESIGQKTGLKDKNGKEIFEGDIIRHGKYIEFVEYCSSLCELSHGSGSVLGFEFGSCWDENKIEIIGNIHEHKHLLNNERIRE